jgi:RNA polymerase sigma-70 factor (ECF subfamily)
MTERIFRYIEQFSEQIQQVFRLRLVDEMSFMEIAEVLGESESSTKMKYYRVVKKIRENFKLES